MGCDLRRAALPVMLVVFFALSLNGSVLLALDEQYERNGEAFILIGAGDNAGVYQLNNHSSSKGTELLYTPGESYGLKVDLQRNIYTFSETIPDKEFKPIQGDIKVQIYYPPESITLPYRGAYGGTRRGNQVTYTGFSSLGRKWLWWGSAYLTHHFVWGRITYPDFRVPRPAPGTVPGTSGWYFIPNGSAYHSLDNTDDDDDNNDGYPDLLAYGERNNWYGYPKLKYWGIIPSYYVFRENQEKRVHNYNKLVWKTGMTAPRDEGQIATSDEIRRHITRCNGCTDGCFPGAAKLPVEAIRPITDMLISSFGRAYFYKRTVGERNGKITVDNAGYTGSVIGDPTSLTTRFIGVSSKTKQAEWVYALGDDLIYTWLTKANFSISRDELDIADVAVSDQWWQTGGIVYAYNRESGSVYKFVRNEENSEHEDPQELPPIGDDVDEIAVDGFGSFYFTKSHLSPKEAKEFKNDDIQKIEWDYNQEYGYAKGAAHYCQKVSKAVFMVDYYGGGTAEHIAEKVLGFNTYCRTFTYSPWGGDELPTGGISKLDPRRITWTDSEPVLYPPTVNDTIRTELSVINVATPPRVVGFRPAHIDIDGPYKYEGDREVAYDPNSFEGYVEGELYRFQGENFPLFDRNGVNVRAINLQDVSGKHVVGGGWTGGFPSTVKQGSVQYYWTITQLKDRYGAEMNRQIFPDPRSPVQYIKSPILNLIFDGGRYKIDLKAVYDWYDYDALPYGSLASDRESVLIRDTQSVANAAGSTVSSIVIDVQNRKDDEIANPGRIVMVDNNGNEIFRDVYHIDEGTDARFVLKENEQLAGALQSDRIMQMTALQPPDPGNPQMIAGSLGWKNESGEKEWIKIHWRLRFEAPHATQYIAEGDKLADPVDIARLGDKVEDLKAEFDSKSFRIPSDPHVYTLNCDAMRTYTYAAYQKISYGNTMYQVKIPYTRIIRIKAMTEIVVHDTTPPRLVITDDNVIYGTTGEPITDPGTSLELPGMNPDQIYVQVIDNNPFGTDIHELNEGDHIFSNWQSVFSYTTFHQGGMINIPYDIAEGEKSPNGKNRETVLDYYTIPTAGNSGASFDTALQVDGITSECTVGYSIPLSMFDDLSPHGDRFPMERDGWIDNPTYSYSFSVTDSSGNTTTAKLGDIIVRDNDLPNLFVEALFPNKTMMEMVPTNIKPEGYQAYFFIDNELEWGGKYNSWQLTYNSDPLSTLMKMTIVPSAPCLTRFTERIYEDTRMTFTYHITDNIGDDITEKAVENELVTWTFVNMPEGEMIVKGAEASQVFYTPGKREMRVDVTDFARDWEGNPLLESNPVKANKRTIIVEIPVLDSRIRVHTLSRHASEGELPEEEQGE